MKDGHFRSDVLQVETEILWWIGIVSSAAAVPCLQGY